MRNLCKLKCEPNSATIHVRGHVRGRKAEKMGQDSSKAENVELDLRGESCTDLLK